MGKLACTHIISVHLISWTNHTVLLHNKELIMIHPIPILNSYISNSCFKKFAVLDDDGIGSLTLVFDSQILQLKSHDSLYPTL